MAFIKITGFVCFVLAYLGAIMATVWWMLMGEGALRFVIGIPVFVLLVSGYVWMRAEGPFQS